jgi:hypothetical protein
MADETHDRAGKLATMRAAREDEDRKRAEAKQTRELLLFELEQKFNAELAGPIGSAFAIVSDLREQPIVIKLGPAVLLKKFRATPTPTPPEDEHAFVLPCVVHPSQDAFAEIVERRAHLLTRCVAALSTLYGVEEGENRGKF